MYAPPSTVIDFTSQDGVLVAHLVVRRADYEIGYRRAVLKAEYPALLAALKEIGVNDEAADTARQEAHERLEAEQDVTMRWLRSVVYPDLMAPVSLVDSWLTLNGEELRFPLTFDQFIHLPEYEELDALWRTAVYTLNAHWLGTPAGNGQAEKKAETATTSTTG